MYKQTIIKTEKLRDFYGSENTIPIFTDRHLQFGSIARKKIHELPDTLIVEVKDFNYGNLQSSLVISPDNIRNYYLLSPKDIIETEEKQTILEIFTPVLDRMMPGHWCTRDNHIFLHYPQINITNSLEQHYTVYDLIVRLEFDNTRLFNSMRGWKYTFLNQEIGVDYEDIMFYHPHLNLIDITEELLIGTFCLGSSSLSNFMTANQAIYNETKAELLLYQIKEYLEWESLEGNPYYSIGSFSLDNENSDLPDLSTEEELILSEKLLSKLTPNFILSGTFEPSVDVETLFKIELELVKELDEKYLSDYSVETNRFISGIDKKNEDVVLPLILEDTDVEFVMQTLNITPKLLPNPERKNIPTIKRINPNLFMNMTQHINNTLHTLI